LVQSRKEDSCRLADSSATGKVAARREDVMSESVLRMSLVPEVDGVRYAIDPWAAAF
jgi:hypothetical protein